MGTSKEHPGGSVCWISPEERRGGVFVMHDVTKEGNKLFSGGFFCGRDL